MITNRPEKRSKALRLFATAIFFLIVYNMLTTIFPPYYRLDIKLSSDQSDRAVSITGTGC